MKNLLDISKHTPCEHHMSDLRISFKYQTIEGNETFKNENKEFNHLIFMLEGEAIVSYNEFDNIPVKTGEFFLIPKQADLSVKTLVPCEVVLFTFNSFKNICDKLAFQVYWTIASRTEYQFAPLAIRYALNDFLYLLLRYLRNGLNCALMNEIKLQELFLVLRRFYSKEELANLFYPLLGKSLDFKDQVMQHYLSVNSVDELARKIGMSRTNFDIKFKNEFDSPPLQWILKQKAKHVRFSMSEPGNTLSDIMRKYNFNSPTHLNRFCKQQFGCTPSELMKKLNPQK
ncbi:MAG: AraC family transcriptional regulator [Tannerellaceae bacterium]|jgi:AraC-like DNA-binding protein|nr:AraC family transcriptional regulator [Tannerellaceae bacterium]